MNNDLISRSELKEDLKEYRYKYPHGAEEVTTNLMIDLFCNLIDIAPTVEYPFYAEAYQTGYEEGKNKRPQGKWITVSRNCWKCPYCQELTNEGKNYCPTCGASMKGGAT